MLKEQRVVETFTCGLCFHSCERKKMILLDCYFKGIKLQFMYIENSIKILYAKFLGTFSICSC